MYHGVSSNNKQGSLTAGITMHGCGGLNKFVFGLMRPQVVLFVSNDKLFNSTQY